MCDAAICEPVQAPAGRYGRTLHDMPAQKVAAIAARGLVQRTGLTSCDIDDSALGHCSPNAEVSAAQVPAASCAWGVGDAGWVRTKLSGPGAPADHPPGATGCEILTMFLRELDRRQARYGLEGMCIGGAQGLPGRFERVGP